MQFTLDELGTSFAFVVSSIFANRLLIAIRAAHFKEEDNSSYIPTMHFAKNDSSRAARLDTTNTDTELTTFNELIGV
jgi:hypothetical protein